MQRALTLAIKGAGSVSTNPMVGAVIVYDNRVIGEGYHKKYAEAHAEVNAINSVKKQDKQFLSKSTMYVTLEPCCHYGKTPPCTNLIIENKIPNLIIAMRDPFPKVDGEGIKILRDNGVNVITGVMEQEALYLNRRFITYHTKKRPYIILKWAETADNFIDSDREANEPAVWFTGIAARTLVHRWRAEEDAIMVGTNTVLRDNPTLTVRNWFGRNPLRVTIDRKGVIPPTANIFNNEAETICYGTESIEEILSDLHKRGVQSLLVEGGAKLLQHFIDHELFDEIRRFTAPITIQNGIKAPYLKNVIKRSSKDIAETKLEIFVGMFAKF